MPIPKDVKCNMHILHLLFDCITPKDSTMALYMVLASSMDLGVSQTYVFACGIDCFGT